MCFHKMSVLVALARYSQIPARYCIISSYYADNIFQATGITQNLLGVTSDQLRLTQTVFGHGYVELLLDDKWIPADITWDEELEVGMGIPISHFGDNPEGVWCLTIPGRKIKMEGLPVFLSFLGVFFPFLNRGILDVVNLRYETLRKKGKEKLKEIGRDRYIASKKKFYFPNFPSL